MTTNKNHPAFPCEFKGGAKDNFGMPIISKQSYFGITKREYYAGQALQGLCNHASKNWKQDFKVPFVEWASSLAIELADELDRKLNEQHA